MSSSLKLPPAVARHWRLAALGVAAAAGFFFWETSRALEDARREANDGATVAVSVRPFQPVAIEGLDAVGIPSQFRDAAWFNGHFVIAGTHGLSQYNPDGTLVRTYRIGVDLPAAPAVSLAVGALAGGDRVELLIATSGEGLVAFDGERVRHIRPERVEQRKLTALLWLGGGRVLLGTENAGLFVYDGRQLVPAHPELESVAVTALAGADGNVWIGTMNRGVLHWRGGEIHHLEATDGLPDPRVLAIVTEGERAYVGTPLGVAEFRGSTFVRTFADGLFASALALRDDHLLVGTLDETVAEIPLVQRTSRGVRSLLQDAPGVVRRFLRAGERVYALLDRALYTFDGPSGLREVLASDREQLTDGNVSALALDRSGRLWVGYFDRGLDILDPQGRRTLHVENDRVFCVNRIVHDPQGGLAAVATANGLVLFDAAGKQKELLGRPQGLIADHVTDLVIDAGRMTVATPAGVTFVDEEGSRSLYAFHGLVNNHVYAIATSGSTVVAGTLGGMSVLQGGAITASYTTANSSLSHNWITAIARVADDWFVGTYGGGVFRLDPQGRWHAFADLEGPIEVNPNAMAVTATHVFVGTLARGLLIYDRGSARWTSLTAGLPSSTVTALAAGGEALYVGTDNGIVRVRYEVFGTR